MVSSASPRRSLPAPGVGIRRLCHNIPGVLMATLTAPVSISHENEHNPWLAAAARFEEAAMRLKLDDGMRKIHGTSAGESTANLPLQPHARGIEGFTG